MLNVRLTALAAASVLLTACATGPTPEQVAQQQQMQRDLDNARAERAALQGQVTELRGDLADAETAKNQAQAQAAAAQAQPRPVTEVTTTTTTTGYGNGAYPANAKPGDCYARVVVPARYENKTERVVKTAATERVEVVPARYEASEERVLVKPASKKVAEVIPAVYRTVQDRVMVKPATERVEIVPAVYRTVEDRQLIKPATTEWKRGHGPIEKIDNSTGEIMCLVAVPAEYSVVKRTVVEKPAEVRRIPVAAEYTTVSRQELVTAATLREVDVPAEYRTVKTQKLAAPAAERRIPVPAQYQDVTTQVKTTEGFSEWRTIICETNATPQVIREIQSSLVAKGFKPGPINGVLNAQTMTAIRAYQQANGLATGGVTTETLDKLGVDTRPGTPPAVVVSGTPAPAPMMDAPAPAPRRRRGRAAMAPMPMPAPAPTSTTTTTTTIAPR